MMFSKLEIAAQMKIMQAWLDGRDIQIYSEEHGWLDILSDPLWDWNKYLYRIKPNKVERPYIEVDPDWRGAWVKDEDGDEYMITALYYRAKQVALDGSATDLRDLHRYYTWLDGSPCGIVSFE